LESQGYSVFRQIFYVQNKQCANICVEKKGSVFPERIVIIGAHYDSVDSDDCPAANDNGSGVAATLELARIFKSVDTDYTIRFVLFANEEAPYFMSDNMGSMVCAKSCKAREEDICLMLSLETMGYFTDEPGSQGRPLANIKLPEEGNFLCIGTLPEYAEAIENIEPAFAEGSSVPLYPVIGDYSVPGIALSDHAAFWDNGFPAAIVTDTAFFRYKHYHRRTDTEDKITFDKFSEAVRGLILAIKEIATNREES